MFGKIIINIARKLKRNLYLETNLIFDKMIIIRDG
jgi:hypothetical protein